jgi:tRNA threonylcarbamoyladenosine biosynthesis protein TsaE
MITTCFIRNYGRDEINFVAQALIPFWEKYKILLITGSIGAGKTTLITEMVKQLGSLDDVTSPTFAYVNKYVLPHGRCVYHFDLYRLKTLDSFYELGFDELVREKNALIVIEWPEILAEVYADVLQIDIAYVSPEARSITYKAGKGL